MDRKDNQSPQDETARILVEFLEVAITGAFERRQYMNVVVQKARQPQLQEYINSAVTGLLPFIQKGLVERVAVIFFNIKNIPVERFIFKLNVNQSYGSKAQRGRRL
ncbi:DNA polymerase zeta processivity subunit-like [Cornus florida]|uniref:DNA polymerase zeta processivity subunit-like n=1 Tax=Cornus florida TaxID=4283 RepID=UPI00289C7D3C|nr:DNA polymerase zeta processivity subunit-like [Cornus florida]